MTETRFAFSAFNAAIVPLPGLVTLTPGLALWTSSVTRSSPIYDVAEVQAKTIESSRKSGHSRRTVPGMRSALSRKVRFEFGCSRKMRETSSR